MARFDRDQDWKLHLDSLSQTDNRSQTPQVRELHRAALASAQITGDEHWDFFLSIVQAKLSSLRELKKSALDKLENSDNFTTEDLINDKLAVRLYGREIEALTWVINLPQDLMEQGELTKQLLGSIDESTH